MSTFRSKLIIGLADEEAGSRVHSVLQNVSGVSNSLTVPATVALTNSVTASATVAVGATSSRVGFFGAAVTIQPTGVTLNNVTSIAAALSNLGLIATTTP